MKRAIITAMTALMLSTSVNVFAANSDDELSIMAAEQRKENDADVTVDDEIETFDDKPTTPVIQSKNPPVEQPPTVPTSSTPTEQATEQPPVQPVSQPVNTQPAAPQPANQDLTNLPDSTGMPSPITTYANFTEAAKKVGYIPLYVPRKSGYAMNNIAVINNNIIELRYGRRWEPTVSLAIRTYKRSPGEELKDISGIYGVKWKVDLSSGMTLYIARVNDNRNVAAWSVGQYTFAAMTENLSFAAFHAFIVEELVDLCNHYFIDLNN